TAEPTPDTNTMQATSTAAQTPNTASTSESKCHMPAFGPPLLANRAKTGTENVWMTAKAKRAVARYSMKLVICKDSYEERRGSSSAARCCRQLCRIFAREPPAAHTAVSQHHGGRFLGDHEGWGIGIAGCDG